MRYDAFISYSHAADSLLAPKLQAALSKLAKPWYRRRALSVFRDTTGLTANPGLWSSITAAMDDSEWFVFLASTDAARSPWVEREIEHWLSHSSVDRLLPVLTEGEWVWDPATNGFDQAASTAVPPILLTAFAEEPRHIDMRWAHDEEHLDLRHSRFRDQVAELAAPMHGLAKDELEGEDVRQHRRTLRIAWGAAVVMFALLLVSGAAGAIAASNARRAEDRREEAVEAQALAEAAEAAARLAEADARDAEATAEQRRLEAEASAEAEEKAKLAEAEAAAAAAAEAEAAKLSEAKALEQEKIALENATRAANEALRATRNQNAAIAAQAEALANERRALAGEAAAEASEKKAVDALIAEQAALQKAIAAQLVAEQQTLIAVDATEEAVRQRDLAVTESLARSSAAQSGPLSLLLGVEAVSSPTAPVAAGVGAAAVDDAASARARQALIAAVARVRGAPDRHPVDRYIDFPEGADAPAAQWQSALSLGGTRLATAEFGGARFTPGTDVPARIFVWDIAATVPTVRTFTGHTDQIGKLAFADQARVLVSTDFNSEVRVWDVVTGDLLGVRASASAEVSPDGRFVLITSIDGGVTTEVYDALEREVTAVKPNTAVYSDAVGAGSFSPDSAWAMVDTASGAALLDLAVTRGVGVLPLLGPAVTSAYPSVDPSGTIATAVLNDVFIGLFTLPDGELAGVLPFPTPVADVAWGPTGSVLAGIDEAGNVSVVRFDDVAGPDDVASLVPTTYGPCALFAPTSCNTRLLFSRGGGQLVIQRSVTQGTTFESELVGLPTDLQGAQAGASYDGAVHAVGGPGDTLVFIERNLNDDNDPNDTSFALERLEPGGSRAVLADNPALAVHEAVVSPDGSNFALATRDGRVRVWDLVDGSGPTEAAANDSPRAGITFDASASRLIGVGAGPHSVWDLGQVGFGTPFAFGATDGRSALTDDGTTILEVDGTNRIVRRHVATNAVTPGAALAPADVVEYLSWGRDGVTVYANLADGTSVVTEISGDIVERLPGTVVTTSADGQRLALRRADGAIDVMRRDTFAVLQTIDLSEGLPADGEPDELDIVALAPDGGQLAAIGPAGVAGVWDVASGDLLEVLPGTSQDSGYLQLQGLAYAPDGTRLVVKTPSNRVTLYNTSTFARVASQQLEPQDVAARVVWSPEGDLVAVDGLFLFDGATLEPLGSQLAARPSTSMRFSADGQYLMAIETAFVGADTVHSVKRYPVAADDLVELACALAGRDLTQAEWDRYLGESTRTFHETCP